MIVIPAIDLRAGKCVRLRQGDYSQETVYDEDPLNIARRFEDEGAALFHMVDLDGARSGVPENLGIVERVAKTVGIPVQYGGGVRTLEIAKRAIDAGVHRVIVGTKLIESPEFAESVFFALGESAAAGIDARDGRVAVAGWTETSEISAEDLAVRMESLGARRFVVTDIARDGELQGPNLDFLRRLASVVRAKVIASGGVSSLHDIRALAALKLPNLEGAIVGKALYEGRFGVKDAIHAAETT